MNRIVNRKQGTNAAWRLPEPLSLLCFFIYMPNERFIHALSRLEAAATRLEALTHVPLAPGTAGGEDPDVALAERHYRLRAGTAEALARLDRLIASGGKG